MARTHTWEISDELWAIVEPLIPTPNEIRDKMYTCQRKIGAGRKRKYSDERFTIRWSCHMFTLVWYVVPMNIALASP